MRMKMRLKMRIEMAGCKREAYLFSLLSPPSPLALSLSALSPSRPPRALALSLSRSLALSPSRLPAVWSMVSSSLNVWREGSPATVARRRVVAAAAAEAAAGRRAAVATTARATPRDSIDAMAPYRLSGDVGGRAEVETDLLPRTFR